MNKKGQVQYIPIGVAFVLGIILLSALPSLLNSISCQNEKTEISRLGGLLSSCQSFNGELKNLLNNCLDSLNDCQTNLNKSSEECNKIIKNVTDEYNLNLQENNLVIAFQQKIKNLVIVIFIPIIFSISVSLLSFNIKFRKQERFILFLINLLIGISYFVILIIYYQSFFKSFFLP